MIEVVQELVAAPVHRAVSDLGREATEVSAALLRARQSVHLADVAADGREELHTRPEGILDHLHVGVRLGANSGGRIDELDLAAPDACGLQRRNDLALDQVDLAGEDLEDVHAFDRGLGRQPDGTTLRGIGVDASPTGLGQENQRGGLFDEALKPGASALGVVALGQIATHVQPMGVCSTLVQNRADGHLTQIGRAVGASAGQLAIGRARAGTDRQLIDPVEIVGIGRVRQQHVHGAADHIGRPMPGLTTERLVHVHDRRALAFGPGRRDHDRVVSVVECRQQQPSARRSEAG